MGEGTTLLWRRTGTSTPQAISRARRTLTWHRHLQPQQRGRVDIFVSKLDSAGNFLWARSMGGTGLDDGQGIAVGADEASSSQGTFKAPPTSTVALARTPLRARGLGHPRTETGRSGQLSLGSRHWRIGL